MRILDLFAGIGGFSLAGHWAGMETAAFAEWSYFQQKVLKKNFPGVPVYGDITQFNYEEEREKIGSIDIVCGGFPCQPFSSAGKRKGRSDDRYLWPEMLRVIREVQPAWVIGENVAGLVSMDSGSVLEQVCCDLEGEGYAVQSFIIPAISKGAPHRRDRIWIVANSYKNNDGAKSGKVRGAQTEERIQQKQQMAGSCKSNKIRVWLSQGFWKRHWKKIVPILCRVDDGLPAWVDADRKRIEALGNAIVPQVAYEILKAIKTLEEAA